jgi:hypothetical protein
MRPGMPNREEGRIFDDGHLEQQADARASEAKQLPAHSHHNCQIE